MEMLGALSDRSLQQDFVALSIEKALPKVSDDDDLVSTAVVCDKSGPLDFESYNIDTEMIEAKPECTEFASAESDLCMPIRNTAEESVEMFVDMITQEPFRKMRQDGAKPKPKRFYRTFWRGISMRAVADNLQKMQK
jgi:hypothetical protein